MPDSPPGGDDKRASVRREIGEKRSSQKQHEPEATVLDTGLNRQGATVAAGQPESWQPRWDLLCILESFGSSEKHLCLPDHRPIWLECQGGTLHQVL